MAIDKTSRKESIVLGSTQTNHAFSVPFEAENTSDVTVYDKDGNLAREGIHYNVTNNALPAATANSITVTWIGSTPAGTYTFYRTSARTQTLDFTTGFAMADIETAFDRLTLTAQNALTSSGDVFDALTGQIHDAGEPQNNSDAATVRYAQEVYSQKGFLCPPVNNTDNNKALYAQSTTSLIWRDPFDVPYPTANTKILQVNGAGEPTWVDPVEYAPTYPTRRSYLRAQSGSTEWEEVDIRQLPRYSAGKYDTTRGGDTLCVSTMDTTTSTHYLTSYCWSAIRWLDNIPPLHKAIFTSSIATPSSVTTLNVAATHSGYINEDAPTTAYNNSSKVYIRAKTSENKHTVLSFAVNSSVNPAYSWDSIISCNLKLHVTSVGSSSGNGKFVIAVLNQTPNDAYCTWEKRAQNKNWLWEDGGVMDRDSEAPQVMFDGGASTSTGADLDIDISAIWMYAIDNNLSTLNLIVFPYEPTSTIRELEFWSNEGDDDDIKIEVKTATARSGYWQKYNYLNKKDFQPMLDPLFQYSEQISDEHIRQPHVNIYGYLGMPSFGGNNTDIDNELVPWETTSIGQGNLFAWNSKLTSTDNFTDSDNSVIFETMVEPIANTVFWFKDQTEGFYNDQAQSCWTRLGMIWYEDE